jgi:hypothetical protein
MNPSRGPLSIGGHPWDATGGRPPFEGANFKHVSETRVSELSGPAFGPLGKDCRLEARPVLCTRA